MGKAAPRVFISYSHDTREHKKWVADLGTRLRENGVDAVLDQWDLLPGDDVPVFMERNLAECDFAILVCTKPYVTKANEGVGGVGYEKMIVTSELVRNMEVSKFIPVIRQEGSTQVPRFMNTKLFIDFSSDDNFEVVFDELLRTIFQSVVTRKPPLGSPPAFSGGQKVVQGASVDLSEGALAIFRRIGAEYDSGGQTWWNPTALAETGAVGRLAGEEALLLLEARGLLERDHDGDFVLSSAGKTLLLDLGVG